MIQRTLEWTKIERKEEGKKSCEVSRLLRNVGIYMASQPRRTASLTSAPLRFNMECVFFFDADNLTIFLPSLPPPRLVGNSPIRPSHHDCTPLAIIGVFLNQTLFRLSSFNDNETIESMRCAFRCMLSCPYMAILCEEMFLLSAICIEKI